MKMKIVFTAFAIACLQPARLLLILLLMAGGSAFSKTKWTRSPFEQKVFVENKGQFGASTGVEQQIFFKAMSGGVNIYFTKQGITYRYNEAIPETLAEKAERKKAKQYRLPKARKHALEMQWLGINPDVEIIAEEKVSFYYSYSFDPAKEKQGIKASAYKKIIYKNLYPGIDAEYIMPEDKDGIKYFLIVHPGADISKIKMKWAGEEVGVDPKGNMIIKSSMGNFVDHAPVTFCDNGQSIESSFELSGNMVSFKIPPLGGRGAVIDPWTTNPNFTGYNAAYDVDYDFAGNVYAYGGAGFTDPFELIKFNAAGASQWVFVTSVFASSNFNDRYGDFAVDQVSGSVYIAEGMNDVIGSRILKINPSGTQIAMGPSSGLMEMWRLTYNSCTKQGVIGGSALVQPSWNAALLDTTLATVNPLSMLPMRQDVNLLAIDNLNNCFMGFSTDNAGGSTASNQLLKCPANTLLPTNYIVNNNFQQAEVACVTYIPAGTPNGMNGMAVNSTDLYTYNGTTIRRHNKNTGAVISSKVISPPLYTWTGFVYIQWGGIAVDECNNIFIGSHDTIYQLDVNLNKVATILAPGEVYDLKLSPVSDLIYVAAENFVAVLSTNITCNAMNISVAAAGSCGSSSANVTVTGGSAPYTYLWGPGGQTGQTANGLATGTYTVTVKDNSCPPVTQTATIAITNGALTASVSSTPSSCLASNGSATVTPTGGSSPFTYVWSPSGGNNPTANGLSAGNYSVTITDASGCSGTTAVTITTSNGPSVLTAVQQNILCNGGNTGAGAATVSGGTSPYTYNWNNGQTTSAAVNLTAGTYTVIVTDASGCTQSQVLSIPQPPPIIATATTTAALCGTNNGTASASGSGGTAPYSYSWNNLQTTSSIANLSAGNYSVTITDANGCTQTATAGVPQTGGPTATATAAATATITAGSSTTLSSSAPGAVTYSWTPTTGLSCTNCPDPIASPDQTTEYCVYIFDASGCYDSACVTVYVTTPGGEPIPCSVAATGEIIIPSAFSPNWDSQNDVISLLYTAKDCIKTFTISIYNRWGEEMLYSENPYFIWDGKHKGKIENTAVFAYVIKVTLKSGEEINKSGNISLLR